jgi:hypothetical protein
VTKHHARGQRSIFLHLTASLLSKEYLHGQLDYGSDRSVRDKFTVWIRIDDVFFQVYRCNRNQPY